MKLLLEWLKGLSFGDVTGTVSLIVSIIGIIIAIFSTPTLASNVAILVFGAYIVMITALLVWREVVYSRKARYAESSSVMHQCIHQLRNAYCAIKNNNADFAFTSIRNSVVLFAQAFSLVTGTNCRACIKTVFYQKEEKDGVYTRTFCRSNSSDLGDKDKELVPIKKNKDFYDLLTCKKTYFFSNDLSQLHGYFNSNWPDDSEKTDSYIENKEYEYISTIVWPIRSLSASEKPIIIGFLCIDSKSREVFNKRYDIDTGAILADSLFHVLDSYRTTFKTGKANG